MPEIRCWGFQRRGLIGAALGIGFTILALLTLEPTPRAFWARAAIVPLGWFCFFVGASFRLWATLYVAGRKNHQLVIEGPYSVCRNPLYFGSFAMALSLPLLMHSAVLAAGLMGITAFYLMGTIPAEERFLRRRHGERFDAYAQTVPMIIPRWSLLRTPATVPFDVRGLVRECRRMAKWIWLPFVAELLAELRIAPWWPHLIDWS